MASKKHKPLFVDDEPETSTTIPEPLHANPPLLEVKETKELTTNILGFGPRFGKPWTREEEVCLLQLLEKGDTVDQIASKMCRSAVSIGCRLRSDFDCKYKPIQGTDTASSLGFSVSDIRTKIESFGNMILTHVNETIRKQLENPSNISVVIDPPPQRIKHDKPERSKNQQKPIDELLSLLRDINKKLDYLIERTA